MAGPMQSEMSTLMVAIPLVGLLFVGMFRLDELFGKTQKKTKRRREVAGVDENGMPICLDPDGQVLVSVRKKR
jgi:hypothetical protein